ncbi:MAG: LrgB family protein [Firmicutes bacterium]|uniref:TIGR00659 family protein n=1 Tax=Melghirimyces thermohalophilus TaxID=1236220 RepID=A0A1G6N9U2_9BACL|nr:LrgB family protein [Melghirimyces thermohalophilus]MDA8352402.1 LrgB family protein [Bacillota bacterium]SDC64481.1 TIGR00659 family protein [Melghirimyces thermohalophilus]
MSGWAAAGYAGLTVGSYLLLRRLYLRWKKPWLTPVLTAGVLVIAVLLLFQIPYDVYMKGGRWIDSLLGPAVVAFAYPLYRQRKLIRRYRFAIFGGVLIGTLVAMVGGWAWARLFGLDPHLAVTVIPQSVTTPVAMELSRQWGGLPALTAVLVILAGVVGAVGGPLLFQWLGVDHTLGRGIGFGSGAHGIGTSRALEDDEAVGAASTVAMTLAAVATAFIGPLLLHLVK